MSYVLYAVANPKLFDSDPAPGPDPASSKLPKFWTNYSKKMWKIRNYLKLPYFCLMKRLLITNYKLFRIRNRNVYFGSWSGSDLNFWILTVQDSVPDPQHWLFVQTKCEINVIVSNYLIFVWWLRLLITKLFRNRIRNVISVPDPDPTKIFGSLQIRIRVPDPQHWWYVQTKSPLYSIIFL